VLLPKYRKRVLRGKIAHRVQELFYEACKVNWWWIEEMKVLPDHVYLIIQFQFQSTECLTDVIQRLKGGSNRILRKELPELEEFLWGDSFWSDGYFDESIGSTNMNEVKKYIKENQDIMPQAIKKPRAFLARE
jgi:putative transposase